MKRYIVSENNTYLRGLFKELELLKRLLFVEVVFSKDREIVNATQLVNSVVSCDIPEVYKAMYLNGYYERIAKFY